MAKLLIWLKRLWHSVYRPDKVMYIGGSDTLPPPLPRDEESILLEKLNTGDFQVRQTLIEHNLRLVVYIARRFENTGIHIEDLISIGTIGLIKAVNTFRTDKNIKLATYASRCIENEILMYLRENEALSKHADWADAFMPRHPEFGEENAEAIIQYEIGQVFARVLECAGVYKCTEAGRAALKRFLTEVQNG